MGAFLPVVCYNISNFYRRIVRAIRKERNMLRSLAEFSKTIKKYAYYPMIIGFVGIASAAAYEGAMMYLGLGVAAVCAALTILAMFSSKLCKKAGIDDSIT